MSAAIATAILESDDGEPATEEQAKCIGDGIVDEVGTGFATANGLLEGSGDLDDVVFEADEAEALAAVVFECLDLADTLINEFLVAIDAPEDSDALRNCVSVTIDFDLIRLGMAQAFQDDASLAVELGDEAYEHGRDVASFCIAGSAVLALQASILDEFRAAGADETFVTCLERRIDWKLVQDLVQAEIKDGEAAEEATPMLPPGIVDEVDAAAASCSL